MLKEEHEIPMFSTDSRDLVGTMNYMDNSQLSQTMLDSQNSQEMYSQSLQPRMQVQDVTSDYWSQSSSQQQEENMRMYASKPLLFGGRPTQVNTNSKRIFNRSKSYGQFIDMQQKKAVEFSQRSLLESYIKLLKEYSVEMKSNFEVMKSEIFSKLQTNTEVVESSLCSSEKVIKKLEDNLHEDLKEHSRSIISVDEIKEKLNQKEIELARRDSEVNCLHEEINQLRATVTKLTEKESLYFQEQKSKLNEILQHVDLSLSKLDNKDDSYALIRTTLETLVNQNNELSQQLSNVYMKQESCVSTVLDVNAKFDNLNAGYMNNNGMNMSSNNFQMQPTTTQCYSYNQARCISTHNKNFYQNNPTFGKSQHNPVILPSVNRPLSHFSPLPLHARKFDVLSNPSPTAVVAPMLSQPEVKKEETSLQKDCNRSQSKDVFELSSDSESGQDLCEIVSLITKKQYKKSQKARPATPSLSVTSSKSSTPVQRSIRRYGKIKKFINPFSPSPAVQTKLDKPSLRRDHNSLNDQWTEAVLATSAKLPPQKNKFGMKSSRCSLAMKRKQGNVFNFDGESDEDLKNLSDMLQAKQRPTKRR